LLQPLPVWLDILFIGSWSLAGALLAWRLTGCWMVLILTVSGAICLVLIGGGWVALLNGVWIPLVPSLLVFALSSSGVITSALMRSTAAFVPVPET
jgi:CHASE2 domain-containing sensor protein